MKWLTFKRRYEPGLQLNLMDVLLLVLTSCTSFIISLIIPDPRIYILPLYIGITFFLFCTVFRVTWYDEVFWYIPFVLIASFAMLRAENFWLLILVIFEPLRIAIIAHRMSKGPYVGVFYRTINNYESYIPMSSRERADGLLCIIREMWRKISK
jgi:hypothetical protein